MDYKCSKEQFLKCENNSMCAFCDGNSLYKNSKEDAARKREQKKLNEKQKTNRVLKTKIKSNKEGMELEKRVASKWNTGMNNQYQKKKTSNTIKRLGFDQEQKKEKTDINQNLFNSVKKGKMRAPRKISTYGTDSTNEAKRQPNSGAMWFAKGDIITSHALMEVKERGTVNGRGEKTITIPKEWLEKQEKEAFMENKPFWYVPFAYKNSEEIYVIKSFDHEIEMVKHIRELEKELEELKKE